MEQTNAQFTVENIEQTLHHFYHDAESQAQANQFLILAQSSQDAWNFAWQLLHPTKASEVQFYGASTLHVKISKFWNELPSEQYAALREKLLSTLFTYVTGPKVIFTRLSIAMSSFVIQTITDFWPSAIADLTSAFQPQNIPNANPHQVAHVLVELLTVLSEEFQTAHLPQARIGAVRHCLRSSLEFILKLVESILSRTSAPANLCEMALKCYSSWSLLGTAVFEHNSLLLLVFDSVYRDEVSQTALETLINVANHPEASKHPNFILEMVDHIVYFEDMLTKAIQDYDMDKCNSIYALIIIISENHCQLLLNTIVDKPERKDKILKLINLILQCSSTPGQYPIDEICSEQAFGFWYTLQDTISTLTHAYERLLLIFHPIFQKLLDVYLVKLRFPAENVYKEWKADEKESFRCYRQDIGDSIMYCYNILRQSALANLLAHMNIATTTLVNDPSQWQYLEACLFAFKEISESVDVRESQYIPLFMTSLRNIPLQNLKIVSATMEAIGSYAEWINIHNDVLGCVVPLLLMGLRDADVAVSATFALKDISRDCYSSMYPFAEQILQACLEALNGDVLKAREKVRVIAPVGKVLSIMPYAYIMKYLDQLLSPTFTQLQQHLQPKEMSLDDATVIVRCLHILSMLFATLDTHYERESEAEAEGNPSPPSECDRIREENLKFPQPTLCVLEKLLIIFNTENNKWDVKEQITEALCDALKRSLPILSSCYQSYLPTTLDLLLYLYTRTPHPSILDMTKQVLVLFSNHQDQNQGDHSYVARTQDQGDGTLSCLSKYFCAICEHTIAICMRDFRDSTDIVESFLQMLEQVTRRAIGCFREGGVSPLVLFQFALAALELPEKPTVKAAAGFLSEFISHSREVPSMLDVVNSHGGMLTAQVLKVIGGDSPRSVVEHMPDILMALNKKYCDNLRYWLSPCTLQEGFPSTRVTQRQKEDFVRLVLKERTNKRRLKETVTEFSLVCRGLIGTEYASQSCQALA